MKKASELNIEKKGSGQKRKHDDDQRNKDAEGGEGGLTKNEEGKDVRSGGKTGQGQGKKVKPDGGKQSNGTGAGTGGAKGRPKKGEEKNKSTKEKKPSKPRSEETVSARTRSRA